MLNKVLLSLGSNIGNKLKQIKRAEIEISKINGVSDLLSSSYYKTEPLGHLDQDWFINSCILLKTNLDEVDLLKQLKNIEEKLGRQKRARWHEREIDIDIILFGNSIIKNDYVTIPHPEMQNRNFVLVPANQIAPEMYHPILKQTINQLFENLDIKNRELEKIE